LERLYFELVNLGRSPRERALNFAATTALGLEDVYARALRDGLELDTVEVEPNPVSPLGSTYWDVKLIFFSPKDPVSTVRRLFRLTIDVSDVIPASIGAMRSWSVR
jgi:hypothetical protein